MSKLQPVRGTHDLLPDEALKWAKIVDTARKIALSFGHKEISVPVFEFTEVFKRTLGEETDIVSKEMYTFEDRGGESITLRPEFTAGICRAIISNSLSQSMPLKVFAYGPVFRYERPQKGRMRQFHQLDIEAFGVKDALCDAEVISVGYEMLKGIGLKDKVKLELNSLGDSASRLAYRHALVEYFSKYETSLSEDSKRRLQINPLRILDSKDEGDRKINLEAPRLADFWNNESKTFFDKLQNYLTALAISYEINPKLVRGLDYYNDTVFEFTTTLLGSQNALLAGGRYDGLIKQMGGQEVPAVGFAAGMERLAELSDIVATGFSPVHIIPLSENEAVHALKLAQTLREKSIQAEVSLPGNPSKAFKKANQAGCKHVLVLGGDEVAKGKVTLKNMETGEQAEIGMNEVCVTLPSPACGRG